MADFKIGDFIEMKDSVVDPDYPHISLSGWQGEIMDFEGMDENNQPLFRIAWNADTLFKIPDEVLKDSFTEGFEFSEMILSADDFVKSDAIHETAERKAAIEKIEQMYFWIDLGEQGIRIIKLLKSVHDLSEKNIRRAWFQYLKGQMGFPQKLIFLSENELGCITGNAYDIKEIELNADEIWAILEVNKQKIKLPLSYFDQSESAIECLQDFLVWDANK